MPRSLYPVEVSNRKNHFLPVGKPLADGNHHQLFVTELGNPEGYPAVFFHGGPGDGCNDKKAGNFNPEKYRIILIDQRGAGKSTPKGSIEQNTTADLLEDMETVRKFLKIDKWVIAGSSWGTTLALLYAEKYPDHVAALVLRGIFLAREQDIGVTLREGSQAAKNHSVAWNKFKIETMELLKLAKLLPSHSYTDTYYDLLTHAPSTALKLMAAANFFRWSGYCLGLTPLLPDPTMPLSQDDVNKLILELSYDVNKCYLSSNQILQNIDVIANAKIPVHIIQGTGDLICPADQADTLQQALPENLVTRVDVLAGHVSEAVIEEAMVNATDSITKLVKVLKKPAKPALAANPFSFQIRAVVEADKPENTPLLALDPVKNSII
jgi:proline iminopeptidase